MHGYLDLFSDVGGLQSDTIWEFSIKINEIVRLMFCARQTKDMKMSFRPVNFNKESADGFRNALSAVASENFLYGKETANDCYASPSSWGQGRQIKINSMDIDDLTQMITQAYHWFN